MNIIFRGQVYDANVSDTRNGAYLQFKAGNIERTIRDDNPCIMVLAKDESIDQPMTVSNAALANMRSQGDKKFRRLNG